MLRSYWHAWLPRWTVQFNRVTSGQLPVWGLPATCTDDDRMASAVDCQSNTPPQLVAICARSHDMANMLCEACAEQGHLPVWIDPRRPTQLVGAHAIIWDGTGTALPELSQVTAQFPSLPILALIDFPRRNEVELALGMGASAVISVPFLLGDLFHQLDLLTADSTKPVKRQVA